MNRILALAAALAVALAPLPAPAQTRIELSGLADVVFRNSGEEDLTNVNFTGASNLNTARTRIFLDSMVSESAQFFLQGLMSPTDFSLYGAYARFQGVMGSPVSFHVGLIPTPVGSYAPRTYSDRNPLIGSPLLQNHHSVLNPRVEQKSVDDLLAQRDERSRGGLPVIYDNCWNTGVEAYAGFGPFDCSLALVSGSQTLPTRDQAKDVPQVSGRLAWSRGPGFVLGASGYLGPYLVGGLDGITYPEGKGSEDYQNGGVGYDLYAATRYLEVNSEVFRTFWEHPDLPTLRATSGYVEGKYKFRPGWYVAARLGFFEPSEVRDGSGALRKWDYPVRRAEYGIGYKPLPRVTTKLVAQHNRFDGNSSLDRDHYMVQFSTAF
jgi:hypothetical protein